MKKYIYLLALIPCLLFGQRVIIGDLEVTGDITQAEVPVLTTATGLALDNTTVFTPDADYEPATKKYVDDNAGGGAVDSVFGRTGAVVAADSDYDASQVDVTPAGNIAATDVQAAIEELDTEKLGTAGDGSSLTGLTTGQLTESTDKNFVSDAEAVIIGNTSGTNTGDQDLSGKLDKNTPITGATKTKITYDADGLVTAGADATTADIAPSTDRNYVTDAEQTVLGNTSGTNTGDQDSIVGITGTKAEFDTAVTDGNITFDGDPPTAHAASHTDGTDDIQSATNAQKGLATAAHITAVEANTAKVSATTENVRTAGAVMDDEVTNLADLKAFDPADYAPYTPTLNAQTGTTYTLVLTDAGKIITATNGAAQTYTIPANASVAFPVGTIINLIQGGAGAVTIEGDTGVTVNGTSVGSVDTTTQYQGAALLKIATDTWIISGAVE